MEATKEAHQEWPRKHGIFICGRPPIVVTPKACKHLRQKLLSSARSPFSPRLGASGSGYIPCW
jgi:hypothetical protein